MPKFFLLALLVSWAAPAAWSQAPRFVVDDEEYVGKVTEAAGRLRNEGRLVPAGALRLQMRAGSYSFKPAPASRRKMEAPDLCDRLRESTLAIGSYYRCPDCQEWHFNSSTGFVIAEGGVLCTCCHVVVAEDEGVKESYLIAADAAGHVFPVTAVLAADPDADTCLLQIDAPAMKPLPLRTEVSAGERVYCLSHPGGYYFMFTQGLVARWNRRPNEMLDEHGKTNGVLTRPILFLNVTAEFAPSSSGAPVVDEAGNVVGQVASIADAGGPDPAEDPTNAPTPSVPVRFCTAAEELLRLASPALASRGPPKTARLAAGSKAESRNRSNAEGADAKRAWQADPHGWRDLFPGAGLKGWLRVPVPATNHLGRNQWHPDAATARLECDGEGGHEMLLFDRELGDGIFHVEFRFPPATGTNRNYNSGVYVRSSRDGRIWHQAQLTMSGGYLFGNAPGNGGLQRFKTTPTEQRMKPAGEWNVIEVAARGHTLSVWLNGAVTCTYTNCLVPRGYLGLEAEGYRIEFRNLKLREFIGGSSRH